MQELDKIFANHEKRFETIAKLSTADSSFQVVDDTPKFSGQARASVNYSIGGIDYSFVTVENYERDAISNTKESARSEFIFKSSFLKLGNIIFVTSSIPYVADIEYAYGYRPFGKAIQSWQQTVNDAVRKVNK